VVIGMGQDRFKYGKSSGTDFGGSTFEESATDQYPMTARRGSLKVPLLQQVTVWGLESRVVCEGDPTKMRPGSQ
jgi:hypothetical protein